MSPDSSDSDRKRSASSDKLKVLKEHQFSLRTQNISEGRTRMPISDNDSGEGAICLEDFVGGTNPKMTDTSSEIDVVDEQDSGLPSM